VFSQIDDWCTYSGSILSKEKCQVHHICRKHNCSAKILTGDTNLSSTNSLRILELTINNKYTWNIHISKLKTELSKTLNIIINISLPLNITVTQPLLSILLNLSLFHKFLVCLFTDILPNLD